MCRALEFTATHSRGIPPPQTAKLGFQSLTKSSALQSNDRMKNICISFNLSKHNMGEAWEYKAVFTETQLF